MKCLNLSVGDDGGDDVGVREEVFVLSSTFLNVVHKTLYEP